MHLTLDTGRCGLLSEKFGVTHRCYDRSYRFCQPLFDNQKLVGPDG